MKPVDIVFVTDLEEGHVFPTFKVAFNLEKVGYRVCYVGTLDVMRCVLKQGFEYHVILEDAYPEGYANTEIYDTKPAHTYFLSDKVKQLMDALCPQLIICSWAIPFDALLLHYRFRIPLIFYHCMLPLLKWEDRSLVGVSKRGCVQEILDLTGQLPARLLTFAQEQKITFKTFDDLVSPLENMPRFLLCPKELDIKLPALDNNDVSLGPCIRKPNLSEGEAVARYIPSDTNKRIILGTAGSQIRAYPERAKKFFKLMIGSATLLADFQMIISIGRAIEINELGTIPANVSLLEWAPQVELLPYTSIAIIHGGLGSVKECVYFGVPMLVFPMGRDQSDNAERVIGHNLGFAGNIDEMSKESLAELIIKLEADENIKHGIKRMQKVFHERENSGSAEEFVGSYIGPPRRRL